jgi:hypothetical protein
MPTTPENIAQKYTQDSMSVAQIASKYHIGARKVKEHLVAQGVTLRTQPESRELYNRTRRPAIQRRTCSQCNAQKNIDQFPRSGKLVSMCMSCLDGLAGCVRRCPHCGHMRLWWSFFVDGFETYTVECRMCRTQLQRGSTLQSIRRVALL